jgi:Zn-finger nucleic acid-binding protein
MSAPLGCPRCLVALALVPHRDRWVAACSQCAGVWLDAQEAAVLLAPFGASSLRPAAPRAGTGPLACPHCKVAMAALVTPVGGIEIDRCPAHGVWFDRDELAHVADLVGRMSGRPAAPMPAPYRSVPAQPRWGPVAGVALAGAAVGTAAAVAGGSASARDRASALPDVAEGALDGVEIGRATVEVGGAVLDSGGDLATAAADGAGEAVGAAVEVGGSVIEGAGDVLGSVFEALGGLFS